MDSRIAKILSNFNFKDVREYMLLVGWGWGFDNVVPTESELRERAQELLESVAESPRSYTTCSTGGFHAHKWTWDDGQEVLELIFALEQQDEV